MNTSFNIRGEPIVCTPKDAYLLDLLPDTSRNYRDETESTLLIAERNLKIEENKKIKKLLESQVWIKQTRYQMTKVFDFFEKGIPTKSMKDDRERC